MMDTDFIGAFKAARGRSVPLVGVTTADPAAAMERLGKTVKADTPILKWDVVRGLQPGNAPGKAALAEALRKTKVDAEATGNPVEACNACRELPDYSLVFMVNMHLHLEPKMSPNIQAVWNLRDEFKMNGRMLVIMAPQLHLSPELEHDVIVLDEPLPTDAELEAIVREQYGNATRAVKGLPELTDEVLHKAVDALRGLAAFTAEQITAMSLTKAGLNLDMLWERKRQAIEQTPGMSVWRGGESLDDVAGYANAKLAIQRLKGSKREPKVVVFIDEIEKMIGGAERDSSGVSQDQLGQMLSYMQDHHVSGMIFIGPPGAGKTAIAKAAGTTLGVPTIALDLGGMKGSLVGESEARVRAALKVVTAVGSDCALFIATCNSIGNLPPELRRRFTRGTFFFDLPKAEERAAIWALYERKLGLQPEQTAERPDDTNWTGAEIAQCATMAWDMGLTLRQAAEYVVPVASSAKEMIHKLRDGATGRFISASDPGVYVCEHEAAPAATTAAPTRRAYALD
jgi:hypothetical protein